MKRILFIGGGAALLLLGLLVGGSAVLIALPPKYAAAALVHTPSQTLSIESAMERLRSDAVLSVVATNLGLGRKWGEKFKEGELPAPAILAILRKDLAVHQANNPKSTPGILHIQVKGDDPDEAAAIANNLASVFCQQVNFPPNAAPAAPHPNNRASVLNAAVPVSRRTNPPGPTILVGCMIAAVPFLGGVWFLAAGLRRST